MIKTAFSIKAFLISLLLFSTVPALDSKAGTQPGGAGPSTSSDRPTIGETFVGEKFTYQIGFWILDNVATGSISLEKGPDGDYIATLTAQTTGVVGWLLRYRKDTYTAHMKMIDGGRRFITKTFEKRVEFRGKVRRGITKLDYEKRLLTWRSWGGGKEEKSGRDEIPEGVYYDGPLTAFYNFRYGVYGPIEEGRTYNIKTFPKKGVSDIFLRIATREEMKRRLKDKARLGNYLADVKIDKELFGSQSGDIEIIFTDDLVPVEAVAKDIIFFGDVRGTLKEMTVPMKLEKTVEGM